MVDWTEGLTRTSSLTEWEWAGIHQDHNLADGHSHFTLPAEFSPVDRMTAIFRGLDRTSQVDDESRFADALFGLAGQTVPVAPALHYSASTSIDLAAKTLSQAGVKTVGVLTPTFDNIAQLLLRAGHELVPLDETPLKAGGEIDARLLESCDAVFLVVPNNPTGWLPEQTDLESFARQCAKTNTVLVIDFSFRFFVELDAWDQYSTLATIPGLDWIFLEDTGKTWPTAELKVGVAAASEALRPALAEVTGELLLNVSPFILQLLTGIIEIERARVSDGRGIFARQLVRGNRIVLRDVLKDSPVEFVSPTSEISVEWLRLTDGRSSASVAAGLFAAGIAVLPGEPFFWDDRHVGEHHLRLALARDPEYLRAGALRLAHQLQKAR